MKKLPLGLQDFEKIISGNYLYVDKTKYLYQLINSGSYYFISRPRRFGKSLTVSTLHEIFSGNKELFKGLWIYDKWEWKKYPVIKISFASIGYKSLGLQRAIDNELNKIAGKNNITLTEQTYELKFQELIQKLAKKEKVVILIDEYDKPIIDYIDDLDKATKNRDDLKNFYSVIKDNDSNIRFLFITGVSKFSKVSIFSDLNNLEDITIDKKFSTLTGYTQTELDKYFPEYIKELEQEYKKVYPDIKQAIRDWYNGYSWDGKNFVYNPFSILALFKKTAFANYWFETGTPTFLLKLIKQRQLTSFDFTKKSVDISVFDKYEITRIEIVSLLFQTGYLTIKDYNLSNNIVLLDYPNNEVEKSFSMHLLADMHDNETALTSNMLYEMQAALRINRVDKFIELIKTMLSNVTYPNVEKSEKYFHSIFYLSLKLLGYYIQSEILTIDGRIDGVIETPTHIYIIEFKLGSAKAAIQQIKDKNYTQKYIADNRQIVLLGIGFDIEKKNIVGYKSEIINKSNK